MVAELNEQSGGDDHARDIRCDEARVMHDLQDRRLVVLLKSSLIKRLAAITQWMIHVDQDIAIHRALGIDQSDAAGKVFWNLGAGVSIMGKLLQCHTERLIIARWLHHELPGPTGAGKCLRRAEGIRDQPGAERWCRRTCREIDRHNLDRGRDYIAIIHTGRARNGYDRDLRARSLIRDWPGSVGRFAEHP